MVRRRNRAGVEVADDHAVTAKDWALPSAEEHAQGQRCQVRRVRVALLPATTAGRRRGPRIEGRFGEPDGDVASGPQPALVRRPVPDPIALLVLGVHSAGFRRGHGFASLHSMVRRTQRPRVFMHQPPTVSERRLRSPARDRAIRQVQQVGRRQWKKDSGDHQQARVENAFFRYKSIIGESLRARSRAGQETEAFIACNLLNQLTQLGRPASYTIGR